MLFNKSLASGHFPQDFKNAVVKPLLKQRWPGYQPGEKLQTSFEFVTQTFGESCTDSTTEFLDSNNMMPGTQSGYRQFHSIDIIFWPLTTVKSLL